MEDGSGGHRDIIRKSISYKKNTIRRHKVGIRHIGEPFYDFSRRHREKKGTLPVAGSSRVPVILQKCREDEHIPSHEVCSISGDVPQNSIVPNTTDLTVADLYLNELNTSGVVAIGNAFGKVLIINDYNQRTGKIRLDRFCIVERKHAQFHDGRRWVKWCSCDESQTTELSSISTEITSSYEDFKNRLKICIHLEVAEIVFDIHDATNDIHWAEGITDQFTDPGGFEDDHSYTEERLREASLSAFKVPPEMICLCADGSYGLLTLKTNGIFCIICRKKSCHHVSTYNQCRRNGLISEEMVLGAIEEMEEDDSSKKGSSGHVWSYKKIPFHRTPQLMENLEKNILELIPESEEGILMFFPPSSQCKECGNSLNNSPVTDDWLAFPEVDVITRNKIRIGRVYFRPCTSCDVLTVYDGQEHSILNMGTYLVGYDILRSYMHSFLLGRCPLFTFYQVLVSDHLDRGTDVQGILTYNKLRNAWNAFVKLLDIDFTEGFCCSHCHDDGNGSPSIVICDGTSLSFQRRMWKFENGSLTEKLNAPVLGFSERIFIPDNKVRNLLKRYTACGDRGMKVLTDKERKDLFSSLKKTHQHLHDFIEIIDENRCTNKEICEFLYSLSSPSPVCAYIHPNKVLEQLLSDVFKGIDLRKEHISWQKLHQECPILFNLLKENYCLMTESTPCLHLLIELWNKACAPFVSAVDLSDQGGNDVIEDVEELSFFPSLVKYRSRGSFAADRHKKEQACEKRYRGHPSLLPGIFTMFCPHGVCLGFELMPFCESPNVPFSIFRTRFKTAPKVVVYDNACALHAYCLNRDPHFFEKTEFYVDRLHWDNHKSCSSGYCLDRYSKLDNLNSQVNEQANSGLKRIKDQLSYMTAENFMTHCAFYLWNKNQLKLGNNQ